MSTGRDEALSMATDSVKQAATGGEVSLEVLCRRAGHLIESVRIMGEQVNRMFAQPERTVAQANDTARSLTELAQSVETKIAEARQAEQACDARIDVFRRVLPSIEHSAEGLIERVTRARELSEAFGRMMDDAGERIAAIEKASAEAVRCREAIATATQEFTRVQQKSDHWADTVQRLSEKQAEFVTAGNAAALRLRTLTDAGERLRESVREDIVCLRELLRESRLERLAWEQLLAHMPGQPAVPAKPTVSAVSAKPAKSVPAALADRVRKLSDFIRQASELVSPDAPPARQASTAPRKAVNSAGSAAVPRS